MSPFPHDAATESEAPRCIQDTVPSMFHNCSHQHSLPMLLPLPSFAPYVVSVPSPMTPSMSLPPLHQHVPVHHAMVDPEYLCRYPSKDCFEPRAVKKTGDLHNFCAFHRAKANRNQRRLEARRRLQRMKDHQKRQEDKDDDETSKEDFKQSIKAMEAQLAVDEPLVRTADRHEFEPFQEPVTLEDEDVDVLQTLLL